MIDGVQAEYVRTPFADNSLYLLPETLNTDVGGYALGCVANKPRNRGSVRTRKTRRYNSYRRCQAGWDELLVNLSILFSVNHHCGRCGRQPPVNSSEKMGAIHVVNPIKEDPMAKILEITNGRGVDCFMEAVGMPATQDICQKILKEGGHLANVRVHGQSVNFEIEKLWIKNITITIGLVNANTTEMLMKCCTSSNIPLQKLATHHFKFHEIEKAWETFKNATDTKSIKVIIEMN